MKERGLPQDRAQEPTSTHASAGDGDTVDLTQIPMLTRKVGPFNKFVNSDTGREIRTGKKSSAWKKHQKTTTPMKSPRSPAGVAKAQPPQAHYPYPVTASKLHRVQCVVCGGRKQKATTCWYCSTRLNRRVAFCSNPYCFHAWHTHKDVKIIESSPMRRLPEVPPIQWQTTKRDSNNIVTQTSAAMSSSRKRPRSSDDDDNARPLRKRTNNASVSEKTTSSGTARKRPPGRAHHLTPVRSPRGKRNARARS